MADINILQDVDRDTQNDMWGVEDIECLEQGFYADTEANFTPIERLENFLISDNVFNRQMAARGLLDTLREVGEVEEDCSAVLQAMTKLSHDPEATVRSELMDQLPNIAMHCQQYRHIFKNSVSNYLLPLVVRYLDDGNNQVRKTSQAALLVLLEQDLVDRADIESQVVEMIVDLASPESPDDYRTEAVALMSKLAPLLSPQTTVDQFLPRFCDLCQDSTFHVKKVCAANFGDMCSVVGPSNCEKYLLPRFIELCNDRVWGVRKACTECFMTVSQMCSTQDIKNDLTQTFLQLLQDQSRWVRISAFQALGAVISTFAKSESGGLTIDEDGNVIYLNSDIDSNNDETETGATEEEKCKSIDDDTLNTSNDEVIDCIKNEVISNTTLCSVSHDPIGDEASSTAVNQGRNNCHDNISTDAITDRLTMDKHLQDLNNCPEDIMETITNPLNFDEIAEIEDVRVTEENSGNSMNTSNSNDVFIQTEKDSELIASSVEQSRLFNSTSLSEQQSITQQSTAGAPPPTSSSPDVESPAATTLITSSSTTTTADNKVHIHIDNLPCTYNSFQYWRSPIPEVGLDMDLVNGTPTNIVIKAKVQDTEHNKVYETEMDVYVSRTGEGSIPDSLPEVASTSGTSSDIPVIRHVAEVPSTGVKVHTASVSMVSDFDTAPNIGSTHIFGQRVRSYSSLDTSGNNINLIDNIVGDDDDTIILTNSQLTETQDVIPARLLESYLSMVDPIQTQMIDPDISRHCAYSLPAVALTLGRSNWKCLRRLYEELAADIQWKVRRTLAFSLYGLAMILGEDITHSDLVPVFDEFLKDLDEVRVGILSHLANFLKLLRPSIRRRYLVRFQEFLTTDSVRNWRFRLELTEQLVLICDAYDGASVCDHILPIALILFNDRVSSIRQSSCILIANVIKSSFKSGCNVESRIESCARDMCNNYASSQKWRQRQQYVYLCNAILNCDAMSYESFASMFLDNLLSLSSDPIANVRITVARLLCSKTVFCDWLNTQSTWEMRLSAAMSSIEFDPDRDVRNYLNATPSAHTDIPQTTN